MSDSTGKFKYEETKYGFRYGPAIVERTASDEKAGVLLAIRTPRKRLEIRVTPSGLIRMEEYDV